MAKIKKPEVLDSEGNVVKAERKKAIKIKDVHMRDGELYVGNSPTTATISDVLACLVKIGVQEAFDHNKPLPSVSEIQLIVRNFYDAQDQRIRMANQITQQIAAGENYHELEIRHDCFVALEERTLGLMNSWCTHPDNKVANWLSSQFGIGPILTANWVSMVDINKASTAGAIMRYFGIDPDLIWLTNEDDILYFIEDAKTRYASKTITNLVMTDVCRQLSRKPETMINWLTNIKKYTQFDNIKQQDAINFFKLCPYNREAKQLAWKTWQSFFMFRNNPNDFYGKILDRRIAYETAINEDGGYKDRAKASLARLKDKTTDTYATNMQGKITESHIINSAGRYTIKIFISHLQAIMYWVEFGKIPPRPYVMEIMGHKDWDYIPNDHLVDFPHEYYKMGTRTHPVPDEPKSYQTIREKMLAKLELKRAAKEAARGESTVDKEARLLVEKEAKLELKANKAAEKEQIKAEKAQIKADQKAAKKQPF